MNIIVFSLVLAIHLISACSSQPTSHKLIQLDKEQQPLVEHLKILSSDKFAGRKTSTKGNKLAQQYIINSLSVLHIDPFKQHYAHSFIHQGLFKNIHGTNIIASVQGKKYPHQYIVLSAHFDHLGRKGNNIYNGADDNASGTAALLWIAEKITKKPLNYSVILLFTDAEEAGLYGSKAFLKQNLTLIPKIKIDINLDMIAGASSTKSLHYIEKRLSYLLTPTQYQAFKKRKSAKIRVKKGFKQAGKTSLAKGSNINYLAASDHSPFNKKKIPIIYYGVGTHINYHSRNDDFSHANIPFFVAATHYIYQQIKFLDQMFK